MNALSLLKEVDPSLEQRERKFLPEGVEARRIWELASRHLRPEHGSAEVAYSRTTYYDTPDLSYYRSCRGPVKRRLRVREYARPSNPDEPPVLADGCFLELKCSTGDARTKNRIAVLPSDLSQHLAALTDAPLAPTVATWYRRRALVDTTGNLRVTLDDRLLLCKPRPLGSSFADLGPGDILGRGPSYVLEYKCTGVPPAWLIDALAGLREASSFSKFQLGMYAVATAGMTSRLPQRAAAAAG
jgi:hypothetical protein